MFKTLKKTTVRRSGLVTAGMLLVIAFVLPSSALAQSDCSQANSDPTAAQYCSTAGVHGSEDGTHQGVKGENGSGENTPATTEPASVEPASSEPASVEAEAVQESSSSSLPFTGLDVGVLALVAVALGGAGLVLRRMTAAHDTRS